MRLLIVTQAVDTSDPILGFFHRWIEEFAKRAERVHVICLREGAHSLPGNVTVHSLGKESAQRERHWIGTMIYHSVFRHLVFIVRFYRYAWSLRSEYDAVFVHMNPEYVVLGGLLWRALGKRIGLWYAHKSVDAKLRFASFFARIIFTASPESFRLVSAKVRVTGHGIDTAFWTPDPAVAREAYWLSAGRLSASKRHDRAIRMAAEARMPLRIAGDGPERGRLERLAREIGAQVTFLGPLSPEALRDEYRRATLFIHTSETGSLDKVVLEARLSGCPVQTSNPTLQQFASASLEDLRANHSLENLVPRIISLLA